MIFSLFVFLLICYKENIFIEYNFSNLEMTLRESIFQIVSVITTTGFVTSDYTQWSPLITLIFFGLMFLGGSSGSTSGGIKVVRHMLMIKSGFLEFKRALHPNAIIQARYNDKIVVAQFPIIF